MVFKKQANEEGIYQDKDGVRYDVLTCERTESMEWYDTGEVDEEQQPIYAKRVAINVGWDSFDSMEAALEAYGLTEVSK